MLISIIVPVYNVQDYLAKCLDSLVNQTYKQIEIIVVNDGSTDQSSNIIAQYENDYPSMVKGFLKENGGLSDARNYGLIQATGEYVTFIDSDDYVDVDLIQSYFDRLNETHADIVVCDMEYVYEKETKVSSGGNFSLTNIIDTPSLIQINNSACNKLFKKSLFSNIQFPLGIWYEDLATVPRLLCLAKSVSKVDKVLYFYVQRESSIVHTQNQKIFDIYIALDLVHEFILGLSNHSELNKEFRKIMLIQGIELTNLRIKEYSQSSQNFLKRNRQLIRNRYKYWYIHHYVWSNGFKKWVAFTLFNFGFYGLLLTLYKKKTN